MAPSHWGISYHVCLINRAIVHSIPAIFLAWAHVDPHSGAPLPSSLLTRSSYGIRAAKSPWLDIHLNSRSLCSSRGVSEVPSATCSKWVQTFTGLCVSPPENGTVILPDMQSRKWRQSPKTPYYPPGIVNLSPGLKNLHSQTNTKYIHFLPLYHHISRPSYKSYTLAPLKGPRSAQIHPNFSNLLLIQSSLCAAPARSPWAAPHGSPGWNLAPDLKALQWPGVIHSLPASNSPSFPLLHALAFSRLIYLVSCYSSVTSQLKIHNKYPSLSPLRLSQHPTTSLPWNWPQWGQLWFAHPCMPSI